MWTLAKYAAGILVVVMVFQDAFDRPVAAWPAVALAVIVYLAPICIAYENRLRARAVIAAVNIVLGVTGVGWLFALSWAVSGAWLQPGRRRSIRA